ncbi:hypothetical protein AX16_000327 [Volvariella volvacea WC 439]|nr:hypothetical protein AX16_000327 [Volvariella volvacea WC 439]
MGKSQKKKLMRRHNPMRVPDSHLPQGLASASSTSSKREAILPLMQKIESPDAAERKWACVAVSNLIQNDPSTRRLLQGKNVVGALITRLTDSEEEVVVEAMGALRNLCIDGGYDICAEMYNKNILTPLKSFVPKISTTLWQYLENPKAANENAQRLVYDFADNVITTLWCLSETSNKALNAINAINLVPFLMSFLASRDRLPLVPVTSAAQCLYVLTDDNQPAITDIRASGDYISCLVSIAQSTPASKDANNPLSMNLRVLVAGILRNIAPIPPPSVASAVDMDREIILPLLHPVISSVSLPEASQLAQQLASVEEPIPRIDKLSIKNTPGTDHISPSERQLEELEAKLRTVKLGLEILTGVCATLPDPDLDTDGPDGKGDEDELEDESLEGDNMEGDDSIMAVEDIEDSRPMASNFLATLVLPLLALVQPTALSFPPLAASSVHPPTTSVLSAIHVGALECLNNIFLSFATSKHSSISSDVESGRQVWNGIWSALEIVGTQTGLGQEKRQEMWEVAIGVLWGVGIVFKGSLIPNEEQIRLLIQLCEATPDEQLKVKCIGTLESLAQFPDSLDANKVISEYFLSKLPSGTAPSSIGTEPLIQIVSALIDIYSDEGLPYDINFRQGKYLDRLVAAVEGIRKAVRGINKKKEGGTEFRRRGEEIRDNLGAFIQYRRRLKL